jgi:SAM-dependent methyltransferase
MLDDQKKERSRDHEAYLRDFNALPFERIMEKFRLRKILEIASTFELAGNREILEIGPGYNSLASHLWPDNQWTLLEPSQELFILNLEKFGKRRNIQILNHSLEKYLADRGENEFGLVILSSVLHELDNPIGILREIYHSLVEGSKVLIVVPNNQSVHRQFGVTLKILEDSNSQTTTEMLMQQKTNYSISTLEELILLAGFKSVYVSTSFVKPHTHKQMQEWVDSEVLLSEDLDHLYDLSFAFHPFNAEIFMMVEKV